MAVLAAANFAFAQNASVPAKTCALSQSVNYKRYSFRDQANQPITAHVVEVDLRDPNTFLKPIGGVGCRKTSAIASQAHALVAVNAGFFDAHCKSVSFLKLASVIKTLNRRERSVLGVDGQQRLSIRRVPAGDSFGEAVDAVGGIPRLVTDGRVETDTEGAGANFVNGRNPRTSVGLIDDQHAIIVVVDGRAENSKGFSLKAMAEFMISLGAKQAVNLDGGGSSAMWVDPVLGDPDGIVNRPSDGAERRVHSALAVFAPANSTTCF